MTYPCPSPDINPDFIYRAYTEIRDRAMSSLTRFDHVSVESVMDVGSPAQKAAMPWAWVSTIGESTCFRVNVTRIGIHLASEGLAPVLRDLGAYSKRLAHLIGQDILAMHGNDAAALSKLAQSLPVMELPAPSARDHARLTQALEKTGLSLAVLHSRIVMRSLH